MENIVVCLGWESSVGFGNGGWDQLSDRALYKRMVECCTEWGVFAWADSRVDATEAGALKVTR